MRLDPAVVAGMMPAMMAQMSADEPDVSRWNIIYPNYIDKKKTLPEGRRIPLANAVETPKLQEMVEICKHLGVEHKPELKQYPRDWMVVGRIRFRLTKPDNTLWNPEVPTKKALMLKMGELIPKLKSRVHGDAAAAAAASSSTASKKQKKKKK
ncbi:unnamed protein product [Vitrella brassicaformis CCMP3155]|uniref:Signal recognition particle 19 kDa protein n=1 Tax=Vitrella brassicaformis (strain CCMP3155) TaxID=1169540 RepID=A0A0G4EF23_VITBC|nr:unnamed protein product [Vitrella brassicaformis CCMP3155]|eukprot:CEL94010.1 unnamed protein product [Vitrella brassicaformis CCMP3155]